MAESHKHRMVKQVAMRWLQKTGCVAWAFEVSFYHIGIVDVCGLKKNGDTYIVEAKISNSDLKNDMVEVGRRHGYKYIKPSKIDKIEMSSEIDFAYYIVADGLDISEIPVDIGILTESGYVRRQAKRRRPKGHSEKDRLASFMKLAKALSWRKYKHVINGGKEQMEFSLDNEMP